MRILLYVRQEVSPIDYFTITRTDFKLCLTFFSYQSESELYNIKDSVGVMKHTI